MKFITVRDLRTTPAQIWKELPEEEIIVKPKEFIDSIERTR